MNETISIEKKNIEAAMQIADDSTKAVFRKLFGLEETEQPNAKLKLVELLSNKVTADESIVVASGDQGDKEYGFLHTWHIDGAAASFANISAGIRWEIIACNSANELGLTDGYDDDDEEYTIMANFVKQLDDLGTLEMECNPYNELEYFVRIW